MTAKLFQHDGSQAVRLPHEFRMPGTEALISKTERGVFLEPVEADFEAKRAAFAALAGACPEIDDVPAHFAPDRPRDE